MAKRPSSAREHILATTVALLGDQRPDEILINELAAKAHVGVPTIYYHFESKDRLMAQAHVERYECQVEPLRILARRAGADIERNDVNAFWMHLDEYVALTWQPGHAWAKLDIGEVIHNQASEPSVREQLLFLVTEGHDRWINLVRAAQARSWVRDDVDLELVTSLFLTASIGQCVALGAPFVAISPEQAVVLVHHLLEQRHPETEHGAAQ